MLQAWFYAEGQRWNWADWNSVKWDENGTVGENAFPLISASKLLIDSSAQSPGESHFWRKCMWHQALNYLWKSKAFHSKAEKKRESGDHVLGAWWDTAGCGGEGGRVVLIANNRPEAEAGLSPLFSGHKAQGDLRWGHLLLNGLGVPIETSVNWQVREVRDGVGSQCSGMVNPKGWRESSKLGVKKKAEFRLRFQSPSSLSMILCLECFLYLESSFGTFPIIVMATNHYF